MVTDIVIMPVDLVVRPTDATEPIEAVAPPTATIAGRVSRRDEVVIVRRRSPRAALLQAELRGAPDAEIRILEEAAIAAAVARVRALLREGGAVSTTQREQFERDRELLRRFPDDRRGVDGKGWFHITR